MLEAAYASGLSGGDCLHDLTVSLHAATCGDIAVAIGAPGAARAVGTAVGQNPVAYLIPCHRVIRKTGILGEYRWGVARKKVMIGRER